MKHSVLVLICALTCGAALAQAPAGVVPRPAAESNPTAAGGVPAAKAEMKTDMKKGGDGAMPMAAEGASMSGGAMAKGTMAMGAMGMGMNMKMMDTNGDGMISKKEWMDYHTKMWGRMKSSNDMVPMADVEAMMKGGPN